MSFSVLIFGGIVSNMNKFIAFLFVFLAAAMALSAASEINADAEYDYKHTKVFTLNWHLNRNNTDIFYDNRTFGHQTDDPCTVVMKNSDFRDFISELYDCDGPWCLNGTFRCIYGNNKNCYNVEHIIDLNGPEYTSENKNIYGNLVMAYGLWNQQLGRLFNYPANMNEKTIVYGQDNMSRARQLIEYCSSRNQPNNGPNLVLILMIICIVILLCITGLLLLTYTNKYQPVSSV